MNALRQVMGDDEDSLGMGVSLSHQAPVQVGTVLTLSARCVSVRGRVSRWDVSARDGSRMVASGCAEFAVVRTAEFVERHGLASVGGPAVVGRRLQSIQKQGSRRHVLDDRDLVVRAAG
jgi:predicted thioesterase